MAREIKFRAWLTLSDYDDNGNDKDYHGMATKISVHHSGDIGFSLDEGNAIFDGDVFERALNNGNVYEYDEWCYWDGYFELMQYTGLKDKNGKDIYEGDIVAIDLWQGNGNGYIPEYGVVRWHQPSAAFKWFSTKGDSSDGNNYWLSEPDTNRREVVGNIYENPEWGERGAKS